jgi:hypothetical protein
MRPAFEAPTVENKYENKKSSENLATIGSNGIGRRLRNPMSARCGIGGERE